MRRRFGSSAVRLLGYLSNHVVAHVPSLRARRAWYSRVLGLPLGRGTAVDLDCFLWFFGPGQIRRGGSRIGAETMVNRGCCLDLRGGLTIGDNVNISPDVTVLTTQHRHDHPGFPLERQEVVIEDYVWIGTGAMVLPGAVIGRGAVVAARAVVRGKVPPLAVVAGVPAVVVGERPEEALGYHLDDRVELLP